MDRRILLGGLLLSAGCTQAANKVTDGVCPEPKADMRYEIYKDMIGEWRWRLVVSNGNTIAESGEGYKNRSACEDGIRSVQRSYSTEWVRIDA